MPLTDRILHLPMNVFLVPVVITDPVVNLTVTVGKQVFLPCAVYGDPVPNVTWYKGQ
jgi:hypothetical protein